MSGPSESRIWPRLLAGTAGIMLVVTALFHGSGYQDVASIAARSSLEEWWAQALGVLWLFFSWHLLVLAVPAFWAAARGTPSARPALFFCGTVVFGDFLWVLTLAGFFAGTALLLLASLCLVASAGTWPKSRSLPTT